MKELRLLKALGQIHPKYVEEALQKPRRRWEKAVAIAACLLLVVGVGGTVIDRLGLFRAGCSAWPGDFVDGRYYYSDGHSGLYCWDDGRVTKVLGALQYDGRLVNGYGVYFTRGRRLYVKPHDTGKTEKLYTAPLFDRSHMGFSFYGGDVVVRIYNKWKEYVSEVLVDGVTGAVLEEVAHKIPYSDLYDNLAWGDTHFRLDDRELVLQPGTDENRFILTENGLPLPEAGVSVSPYARHYGNELWFEVRDDSDTERTVYIARPDGDDTFMTVSCGNGAEAAGGYAYWVKHEENQVWCMDTRTGASWQLATDTQTELYELATDGVHLFSCVPWDDYQALWKVEYDEANRPAKLVLLDPDIRK